MPAKVGSHRFFASVIGCKGDWPYLRKVGSLHAVIVWALCVPFSTRLFWDVRPWRYLLGTTAKGNATYAVQQMLVLFSL